KRAFATFGKPFGLELYRQSRSSASTVSRQILATTPSRFGFHPDDTTPIPRPSRYYGHRQSPSVTEQLRIARHSAVEQSQLAPSLAPAVQETRSIKIDKSALTLAEPKRRRDKTHLRFVASQPCLICERQPSDPHHLRFAQPRA